MNFPHLVEALWYAECRRFSIHEHFNKDDPLRDHFGYFISGLAYMYRTGQGAHEYLSLISYENRVIEVIYERYLAPKNTRRPKGKDFTKAGAAHSDHQMKGYSPVALSIYRDWDELKREVLDKGA